MSNKYSLHLGVNAVDPTKYSGKFAPLLNAENDAGYYHQIAVENGFTAKLLLSQDATRQNLIDHLTNLAGKMQAGDLLFLSYSGHGTSVPDLDHDEPDGWDEAMVLYDALFIDDMFQKIWPLFPEKSKIFFVSDSCFNGTVTRLLDINFGKTGAPHKSANRGISHTEILPDFRKNIELYKTDNLNGATAERKCQLIHIAACADDQTASDGSGKNGLFTSMFKQLYTGNNFQGSYKDFFPLLLHKMPQDETPQWDIPIGGPGISQFENEKIFQCD